MKIKSGFLLREIAGTHVVVPVGKIDFDGMITLNETGAALWQQLGEEKTREQLLQFLTEEFDVDENRAGIDLDQFLSRLSEAGVLDEA